MDRAVCFAYILVRTPDQYTTDSSSAHFKFLSCLTFRLSALYKPNKFNFFLQSRLGF